MRHKRKWSNIIKIIEFKDDELFQLPEYYFPFLNISHNPF